MQQFGCALFYISMIFMSANGAILSGHISTTDGTIPKQTKIVALDVITRNNYTTTTTTAEYSLELPDSALVEVSATSTKDAMVGNWTVPGYFPATVTSIQLGTVNTTYDLQFEPCFTLVLSRYNSQGSMDVYSSYSLFSWASNIMGEAIRGYRIEIYNGDISTLGFSVGTKENATIMMEFSLLNGDNIILFINNNGYGFSTSEGPGILIDVNKEIASTALFVAQQKNFDSRYTPVATSSLYNITQKIDTLSSDPILRSTEAMDITTSSLNAETTLEIEKAHRAQYRRSNVDIKAVDQHGNSVEGIEITLDSKMQDFRFGVVGGHYTFNTTQAWRALSEAGINSATVDFWWSATEPTSGNLEDSDLIHERISYLLSLGLKLRATGLFQPSAAILPSYATGLNFTQFGQALKEHVYAVVSKYCQQFEVIEVSTDLNILGQTLGFDDGQIQSLQQLSLRAIRSAAPGVRTSITSTNRFRATDNSWLISKSPRSFAKEWMSSGLSVDQNGISIYNGVDAEPQYTLGHLSGILDNIDSLGRSFRVSQFTVPLSVLPSNRDQYMDQFYSVAYSKNNIAEITWANLIATEPNSIGLFNRDMTPTELFYTMRDTINRLSYNPRASLDNNGIGNTSPTGGLYTVNVWKNGKIIGDQDVHITEGTKNRMVVLYNNVDNTASISYNTNAGAMPGVLPTPAPQGQVSSSLGGTVKTLQPWAIFLISFGTVVVVTGFVAMIIFAVVKRMPQPEADIETTSPVGNVAPISVEDVKISPETWTERPLGTVALAEEQDEEGSIDDSSSCTETDDMDDVQLDDDDVRTTPSSSESDEEHL